MSVVLACVLPASAQAAVLYDQTDNPASADPGTNSQNFESGNDQFDDQAADDFVVPAGQSWLIDRLDVVGHVVAPGTSSITSANVFLFPNQGTLPSNTAMFTQQDIVPINGTSGPSYQIPVSSAPPLGPGTYWVSVQVNLNFSPGSNNWAWDNRADAAGHLAAWRNPGNGSNSGCTSFAVRLVCQSGVGSGPDQLFALNGTCSGDCPVPPNPSPASAPSNIISLGKPVLNKKKGTATEPVFVPGPGVLMLTGSKGVVTQRPIRASVSRAVSAAGVVNLLVKPKGKTKKKLNKTGKARVKVTITFTPTGGSPNSQTKTINLKKKLS